MSHDEPAKFGDEHEHHFHTVDPHVVAEAVTGAGMVDSFAGYDGIANRPSVVLEFTQPTSD